MKTATTTTTEVRADNFEALLKREGIVFIDWWAPWCGPCRRFGPIFEAAAQKHPDITWGKVNTDAEQDLAGEFAIRSIPTLMAFRDGVLVFEQPGMLPAAALASWDDVRRLAHNDFEPAVAGRLPAIGHWLDRLRATGAFLVCLAGSGGAIVALYQTAAQRDAAWQALGADNAVLRAETLEAVPPLVEEG